MDLTEDCISSKFHPGSWVLFNGDLRLEPLVFLMANKVVEKIHQHKGVTVLVVIQHKAELIEQQSCLHSWAIILARFIHFKTSTSTDGSKHELITFTIVDRVT